MEEKLGKIHLGGLAVTNCLLWSLLLVVCSLLLWQELRAEIHALPKSDNQNGKIYYVGVDEHGDTYGYVQKKPFSSDTLIFGKIRLGGTQFVQIAEAILQRSYSLTELQVRTLPNNNVVVWNRYFALFIFGDGSSVVLDWDHYSPDVAPEHIGVLPTGELVSSVYDKAFQDSYKVVALGLDGVIRTLGLIANGRVDSSAITGDGLIVIEDAHSDEVSLAIYDSVGWDLKHSRSLGRERFLQLTDDGYLFTSLDLKRREGGGTVIKRYPFGASIADREIRLPDYLVPHGRKFLAIASERYLVQMGAHNASVLVDRDGSFKPLEDLYPKANGIQTDFHFFQDFSNSKFGLLYGGRFTGLGEGLFGESQTLVVSFEQLSKASALDSLGRQLKVRGLKACQQKIKNSEKIDVECRLRVRLFSKAGNKPLAGSIGVFGLNLKKRVPHGLLSEFNLPKGGRLLSLKLPANEYSFHLKGVPNRASGKLSSVVYLGARRGGGVEVVM